MVKQPRTPRRLERALHFQFAMTNVHEVFEFAEATPVGDMSPQEIEALAKQNKNATFATVRKDMSCMKSFFQCMNKVLTLKLTDDKHAALAAKQSHEWALSASSADDKDRGDRAEEALEEACTVWRAFADSMNQMEMLRAADYCDEVFDDGKHKLRQFYCCMGWWRRQ